VTRRIGVFGGTFDPPHIGHLIVAADAYEQLGLDLLLFVPAAVPPHKTGVVATAEQRLRMLNAALEGDDRFAVDDLELRRSGPSYTIDTLTELSRREPDAELIFLLGIDQFRAFSTWVRPHDIATMATLAVMARDGDTPDLTGPFGGIELRVTRVDLSSTRIRAKAAAGADLRYYVAPAVVEVIAEEGLYRSM
jgi:nicotinate-nucleotide adenylyltransferase